METYHSCFLRVAEADGSESVEGKRYYHDGYLYCGYPVGEVGSTRDRETQELFMNV